MTAYRFYTKSFCIPLSVALCRVISVLERAKAFVVLMKNRFETSLREYFITNLSLANHCERKEPFCMGHKSWMIKSKYEYEGRNTGHNGATMPDAGLINPLDAGGYFGWYRGIRQQGSSAAVIVYRTTSTATCLCYLFWTA